MKNVFSKLRSVSLRTKIITATIAAAIIVPAALQAWGPTRDTYTVDHPADHITFNSITDNPNVGDERNFVRIKDASDTNAGGWKDQVNVQDGHEYLVQMYVHNNAASSLNLTATNTRVMATVPNNTAKSITVEGFITADNASPNQIWDQAIFNSSQDFNLTYEAGSTKIFNNAHLDGTALPDSIVTSSGALVGYQNMDGNFPGCFQYAGYVYFRVKANAPQTADLALQKTVSKHGANDWKESYTAQPGETVDYLLEYKNTGTADQKDVVIKDTLPDGMSYVNGSTKFGTVAHPDGVAATDGVTGDGINIGDYGPGEGTWVMFSAKVANNDSLPACGNNLLHNVGRAETDYGYKEDSADVNVTRTCAPGQITVCNLATRQIVTINESDFDSSKYSKNVADCSAPGELPHTGIDTGVMTFAGLGMLTAGVAYAIRSDRLRTLLRR